MENTEELKGEAKVAGKVVTMQPKPFSKEEQEVMEKAKVIQEKKNAEYQAQEDAAIAELVEKYGIGRPEIDVAIDTEKALSSKTSGVQTVADGIEFYKDLTPSQVKFLAVVANSRANQLQHNLNGYAAELDRITQKLDTLLSAQKAEQNAKDLALENAPELDFPKE
jgi:hypothetical protein